MNDPRPSYPPPQPPNPGGPGRQFTATDPDGMPVPDFPGDPYARPRTQPDDAPTPDGPAPQPTPGARELVAA